MDFSAEEYFKTQLEPSDLNDKVESVKKFIERQKLKNKRVVLITSGGTTVPLEKNTVRFLDNFSAGTRGATSAEYFLNDERYSVIFMHRQHSLQPFTRHFSHTTNPFLDLLILPQNPEDNIVVDKKKAPEMFHILKVHNECYEQDRLYSLSFVTVTDYLFLLRAISKEMQTLRKSALYYLAAAVSDFFIPRQKINQHKIQSRKGSLQIEMDQTPKVLGTLKKDWTPDGYIVSFKLETDLDLLIPKAISALEKYKHHLVIANNLKDRKYKVTLVERIKNDNRFNETVLNINDKDEEIEEEIIKQVISRHDIHLTQQKL